MKIMTTLACMELSGIGVNLKSLQELSSIISNELQSLETKAYDMAGKKFNFSSSKEVGQVREVKIFIVHINYVHINYVYITYILQIFLYNPNNYITHTHTHTYKICIYMLYRY